MLRVVGIVALFVLAACAQTAAKVGPSPSPVIPQGNWTQSLTFAGDVPGQMTAIVPDAGAQQSTCSGSKARNGEVWSDSFFGTVDTTSGNTWQVTFVIDNFRGPGTYMNKEVAVVFQSPDNTKAWLNQDVDKVTFTMERSQQAGTIDALLTNATSGKNGTEHITGHWNCKG
jgi:hypothetical protein